MWDFLSTGTGLNTVLWCWLLPCVKWTATLPSSTIFLYSKKRQKFIKLDLLVDFVSEHYRLLILNSLGWLFSRLDAKIKKFVQDLYLTKLDLMQSYLLLGDLFVSLTSCVGLSWYWMWRVKMRSPILLIVTYIDDFVILQGQIMAQLVFGEERSSISLAHPSRRKTSLQNYSSLLLDGTSNHFSAELFLTAAERYVRPFYAFFS